MLRHLFKLALALGKTVEEVLSIDPDELTYWLALGTIEPWDREWRADYRNAQLCALIANLVSSKGKKSKYKDWLPDWWQERPTRRATTWQGMKQAMMAWNAVLGGEFK